MDGTGELLNNFAFLIDKKHLPYWSSSITDLKRAILEKETARLIE